MIATTLGLFNHLKRGVTVGVAPAQVRRSDDHSPRGSDQKGSTERNGTARHGTEEQCAACEGIDTVKKVKPLLPIIFNRNKQMRFMINVY